MAPLSLYSLSDTQSLPCMQSEGQVEVLPLKIILCMISAAFFNQLHLNSPMSR